MNNIFGRFFGFLVSVWFIAVGSVSFGAVSLPIGSEDQLREYALDKAVRGYKDVTADSIREVDNSPLFAKVVGNGAEDVLNKLLSIPITFSLANTNDEVRSQVWLYDSEDRLLFYGQSRYKVGTVGKTGSEYSIWMQDVPLLDNVQSAKLFVVNSEGVTVNSKDLRVENGQVIFDPYLAGSINGIMTVMFTDGSESVFDLSNPKSVTPAVVTSSSSNWNIEGHHVIQSSDGDTVLIKFIEFNYLPTVLVTVKEGQKVVLDVMGAYHNEKGSVTFERPNRVFVSEVGGEGWGGEGGMLPDTSVILPIPQNRSGMYRIRFGWENFRQGRRLYDGPNDGEGKG